MSEYTIRSAEAGDGQTLVAFAVREATETEGQPPEAGAVSRGVLSGLDGTAPVTYWVAETDDDTLVGSISVVREWSNFRGGDYWWVQSLSILPEHRGRGLVDAMLDCVAQAARDAGALDLRLYVLQSNARAVAAYRRCGFDVAPYSIMRRAL